MMELLREMLSYPFIVRALTGGLLISLCASLLGVSLVLKRYSMIGDGLSHVSFGALSVAVAFGWAPLAVSIPVVAAAAVLTAVTIVLGMRMMGAMLISSLIIFPALTSMRVFKSFSGVILSAGTVSVVCFFIGLVLSYVYSIPAGASVVVVNMGAFGIFSVIQAVRRR